MMPQFVEDRLLSAASVERLGLLLAQLFAPVLTSLSDLYVEELPGTFVLSGDVEEGWDWVLHRFVLMQRSLCHRQEVIFTFPWTAQPLEETRGKLLYHLLDELCVCCQNHPQFAEVIGAHSAALAVFFPRICCRWSRMSEDSGDPFQNGMDWPVIQDSRFFDLVADELTLLLQKLLVLAGERTGHTPLIGIANLHWVDNISLSVLTRLMYFVAPGVAVICIHLDEARAEMEDDAHRLIGAKLDKLVATDKAQRLPHELWGELEYPLRVRDSFIYASHVPLSVRSSSQLPHRELITAILATLSPLYRYFFTELISPRISFRNTAGEPPTALLNALAYKIDVNHVFAYQDRLLIHEAWKSCLQVERQPAREINLSRQMPSCRLIKRTERVKKRMSRVSTIPTSTTLAACCLQFGFDNFERMGASDSALCLYEAAVPLCPNEGTLLMKVARLHKYHGDMQAALRYLEMARNAAPGISFKISALCHSAVIEVMRANIAQASGYIDHAKHLLHGLDVKSEDHMLGHGRISNVESLLMYRARKFDEAAHLLRNAIDSSRRATSTPAANVRFNMYRNLGRVQQRAGCTLNDVVSTYSEALAVASSQVGVDALKNRVGAHTLLAFTFLKMGQPQLASDHFEALLKQPANSLRMSSPTICRQVMRLFRHHGYDNWASLWNAHLRSFYQEMSVSPTRDRAAHHNEHILVVR